MIYIALISVELFVPDWSEENKAEAEAHVAKDIYYNDEDEVSILSCYPLISILHALIRPTYRTSAHSLRWSFDVPVHVLLLTVAVNLSFAYLYHLCAGERDTCFADVGARPRRDRESTVRYD